MITSKSGQFEKWATSKLCHLEIHHIQNASQLGKNGHFAKSVVSKMSHLKNRSIEKVGHFETDHFDNGSFRKICHFLNKKWLTSQKRSLREIYHFENGSLWNEWLLKWVRWCDFEITSSISGFVTKVSSHNWVNRALSAFFSFLPFLEIRFWSLLYKKAKLFWLWYKKWATRRVKVMELGWGMWLKWLTPRTFNPLLVAFKPRWPITPLSYKPPKTHWPNECNKNRMSGSQDADSRKNHYRGD